MTQRPVLDPTLDVELLGNTLELGRPELAEIMERYVPDRPRPGVSTASPPVTLVVGDGPASPLQRALEDDGWRVEACRGPAGTAGCAVMRGQRCTLRDSVDAAVVYVEPGPDRPQPDASSAPLRR